MIKVLMIRWIYVGCVVVGLAVFAAFDAHSSQIDEIAYFSNTELKDLSVKAVALLSAPALAVCGRRRELKVTGRGTKEQWPDILQSAFKRESSRHQVVRVQSVSRTNSSLDAAVNRLLLEGGYRSETPSEADANVVTFKSGVRASQNGFLFYTGQVRAPESTLLTSFLAVCDQKQNEVLILSLGEDLCR